MTLLREIQLDATSSSGSVSNLLRKIKILARRLKSKELEGWADKELNGYSPGDPVPDYRKIPSGRILGDFNGPFGSGIKNGPIPLMCIANAFPDRWKDLTKPHEYRDSISSCESMLSSLNGSEHADLQYPWPADLAVELNFKVYERMACLRVWEVVPGHLFSSMIDAVKSRILDFAMDIEEENPNAGEAPLGEMPIPEQVVRNVFNQTFHAPVGNIAAASTSVSQNATLNPVDKQLNLNFDVAQLLNELEAIRQKVIITATTPEDFHAVAEIASAESAIKEQNHAGLLDHLRKAGSVALQFAVNTGASVAAEAIKYAMHMGPPPH